MSFHHDSVRPHRLTRDPYFPLDAMCTIHYLTDVTAETPAFAVVPRSCRHEAGVLTQGGQGGRPAPLASRWQRIPTHFLLSLHGI